MITISIMGLDVYNVSLISKKIHNQMVKIYGCKQNELLVYGSEGFLFHHGIDQSSWDVLVRVFTPKSYQNKQKEVATYLLEYLQKMVIHRTIEFIYYDEQNRYQKIDKGYPRFITDANVIKLAKEQDDYLSCDDNCCAGNEDEDES